ncbi:MAG: ammonium transporter [Solirubrobacteraceae bacterium]|nr:ammonium transporter [Solirubrobacteraceae bacterium]
MSRSTTLKASALAAVLTALIAPTAAFAQALPPTDLEGALGSIDLTWIAVGIILVFFMQAGFAFLEIGFSRGKNVGAGIAKILVNFSVGLVAWWAIGYAIVSGGDGWFAGNSGFFFQVGRDVAGESADAFGAADFVFGYTFAAVALAIVWGATLERVKFVVYPIFALVFAGIIYPLIAHWGFGGGLFAEIGDGVQDFAGSSVVHLTGATAALAGCLLLGPRKGKYGPDGKPRAIPGHSMPLFGLGVLILWLGWFGFNGASGAATDGQYMEAIGVTNLGAAGGVIGALIAVQFTLKSLDVGMIGNGAIAGLVAVTAPAGYIEFWAAPLVGFIGGVIVVYGVLWFERIGVDDPVGATSAHGLAGIWGTLACGIFTSPRILEQFGGDGREGLVYGGGVYQLGVQAAAVVLTFVTVFALSYATFYAIKVTIGIRSDDEAEDAGLDISDHGMYGYPEQFIPPAELVGYGGPTTTTPPVPATAMSTKESTV